MTKRYGIGGLACLFLLLASIASGQALPGSQASLETRQSCGAAGAGVFLPIEKPSAAIVLYALPRTLCTAGARVEVLLAVGGRAVATESFVYQPAAGSTDRGTALAPPRNAAPDRDVVVFELFDREPQLRERLLAQAGNPAAIVTIAVGGNPVLRYTVDELLANSEAVKQLGVLPELVDSPATEPAPGELFAVQPKLWVCGDGVCNTGGPHPETCESCPEDCFEGCGPYCGDGSCNNGESCASCSADCGVCCPQTLPNQTRTELVSAYWLTSSCMQDIFYPWGSVFYDYYQLNFKQTTVARVQECNGSITETVIAVSYYSDACYHYTGSPCSFGAPYTPYCYFF